MSTQRGVAHASSFRTITKPSSPQWAGPAPVDHAGADRRWVVHLLLESFGCDCETAADGTSDLTHVDEGGWDLVLTDLAMPKMSGWEVVEAIRQRAPTLPIVLMTGLNSPDVMRRATVWGLQILSKPFLMQTFKATVVEALYLKAS